MPLVSVNLVTKDRAKYLPEAIESVLAQTFSDWEFIIIDDASSDNTAQVVGTYAAKDQRIKYFREERNLGIAGARNLALQKSQGKYIAVLDSDDVWLDQNKLKKQVDFLSGHSDYVLVGGWSVLVDEAGAEVGRRRKPTEDSEIRKEILKKNRFAHSSVMYLREAVLRVGGYDNYRVGEDYALWLKMGQVGKFANLSEYLIKYRQHAGGATADKLKAWKQTLLIIKKFRKVYPSYFSALFGCYARLIGYFILNIFKS